MVINFGNVRKTDCVECVSGVTWPNPLGSRMQGPGTPYRRAPRLGPWAFSISLVNLFGSNFVWRPTQWIAHPAVLPPHNAP